MACCRASTRGLLSLNRFVCRERLTSSIVCHHVHNKSCLNRSSLPLPLASAASFTQQKLWLSHHSFPYPDIHTEEAAKTFVIQLDERSRSYLLGELQRAKKGHELIVDKSNSPVSAKQLYQVFIFNGVPFIGFGLLDNFIMIIAGEYIDQTLGVALGISTMAAAGLGNLISDIAGIGTAGWVEVMAGRIGVHTPDLSPEQAKTKGVHWMIGLGRVVGITIGCLIGMFPLLFFKSERGEEGSEKVSSTPSKGPEKVEEAKST